MKKSTHWTKNPGPRSGGFLSGGSAKNRGFVLYMALILLLAVTVIAVMALRGTTTEEIMARNHRDLGLAIQAAETQVNTAEAALNPSIPSGAIQCTSGDELTWAAAQTTAAARVSRIDPCSGSSSLAMGGSSSQKTDLQYRILATAFDDPARRASQVVVETVYIP